MIRETSSEFSWESGAWQKSLPDDVEGASTIMVTTANRRLSIVFFPLEARWDQTWKGLMS